MIRRHRVPPLQQPRLFLHKASCSRPANILQGPQGAFVVSGGLL
jgi:hypothetical protein